MDNKHPATHNLPKFQQMQYDFAAWIRTPQPNTTPQNIERRRMDIYRSLFLNNVAAFLENAFPVTKEALGQKNWQPLVEAFFANHLSESPYFKEIPEEFMAWFSETPEAQNLPEWVMELLHYEWLELYITAKDGIWPTAEGPIASIGYDQPVALSPFFEMAAYRYPVHTIAAENIPEAPSQTPTFLGVYRLKTHAVRFMTLAPHVAMFIEFLREEGTSSPQQAAAAVSTALNTSMGKDVFMDVVTDLQKREILFPITS